jgi:hypothetical protein
VCTLVKGDKDIDITSLAMTIPKSGFGCSESALQGHAHRVLLVLLHHRLVFGSGDVLPCGLVVLEGFYGQLLRLLRHGFILCPAVHLDAFEAFMRHSAVFKGCPVCPVYVRFLVNLLSHL